MVNIMKKAISLAAMLAVSLSAAVSAQSFYDDDIYYDASRETKKKKTEVVESTTLPGPEGYVVDTRNLRDVDEYNRRYVSAGVSGTEATVDAAAFEADPYMFTRRLSRFDNENLLDSIDTETAYAVASSQPYDVYLTVNNYDVTPSWYTGAYFSSWGYPSWYWGTSFYSPAYWGYPYYYDYWGPGWSYVPGWNWGGCWGPSCYPGGWAPAPHPNHVYNPRHQGGSYRPGGNVASRPSASGSSGTRRPTTGSYLGNGYRPGSKGAGSRPASMSTSGTRRPNAASATGSYTGVSGSRNHGVSGTSGSSGYRPSSTGSSSSGTSRSSSGGYNSSGGSRSSSGSYNSSGTSRSSSSHSGGTSRSGSGGGRSGRH